MIDQDQGHFDVRAMTPLLWAQRLSYTKTMLLGTIAASLTIVGAGAFVLSFWL